MTRSRCVRYLWRMHSVEDQLNEAANLVIRARNLFLAGEEHRRDEFHALIHQARTALEDACSLSYAEAEAKRTARGAKK